MTNAIMAIMARKDRHEHQQNMRLSRVKTPVAVGLLAIVITQLMICIPSAHYSISCYDFTNILPSLSAP